MTSRSDRFSAWVPPTFVIVSAVAAAGLVVVAQTPAPCTKETNADEVWKYTDTNGDGVADKKELFDTGHGRLGNVEGQEAFLTWTLDNWMYSTYDAFRARWTPHGIIKEPTGSNGGEWGVTQDNDGAGSLSYTLHE